MKTNPENRKTTTHEELDPADKQPTAFKNMDTGSISPHGDSMHDEGKTTSRVNRAAEDRTDTGEEPSTTDR